jgi:hypothetical protein
MNLWWLFFIAGILAGIWLVRKSVREWTGWGGINSALLWIIFYVTGLFVWVGMHIFARSVQGSEHYWWLFLLAGFAAGVFLFSWKIRRGIILLLLTGLKKVEEALLNKGDDDSEEIKRRGNRLG